MNILVINAGSSSLKYQLLNPATGTLLAKGLCERIGIDGKFTYKSQVEGKQTLKAVDVAMPTESEAIQTVLNALVDPENGVIASMNEIGAVGHRVVHGGEKFASSVLITDEVMAAIEECTPLAPLHNPANIIEMCIRDRLGHGHNDGAVQGEQVLRGVVVGLEVLDGEGPRDDGHQVDGGGGVHQPLSLIHISGPGGYRQRPRPAG